MNGRKKAFTLIELLVVIAIIALLLAILMPALGKVKEAAKLTICSSNTRQVLVGVTVYTAGNDDTYPASICERSNGSFSWPNYLNYHSAEPDQLRSIPSGGAMYIYLGEYLPEYDVYMCPLSAKRPDEFQQQYIDYTNYELIEEGTHASYNFFWGGYKFANPGSVSGKYFVGPKKGSDKASSLLISDVMSVWRDDIMLLSHKGRTSAGIGPDRDPVFGNDMSILWWLDDQSVTPAKNIKMNAGYTDGHVEKYTSEETEVFNGSFYLPLKWD